MPLSVDKSKRIRLWGRCLRSSAAPQASHSCELVMRSPFRSTSFPGSRTKAPNRCHFASSPPAIRMEPSMPSFGIAKRELLPCPIPRFTALPRSWAALVELNDTKGTKVPGPLWPPPRIASSRRFPWATFTAVITSATSTRRVTAAGRLSITPLSELACFGIFGVVAIIHTAERARSRRVEIVPLGIPPTSPRHRLRCVKSPPARYWRSYSHDPLPSPAEAMDLPLAAFPSYFLKITCDRCDKDRMRKEGHAPDIYADDHAALYDRSQACRTYTSGCAEHRGCNQHP